MKKVTIRDVANDAGVSVAAVSKVLRNAYGVSEELRSKVQNSIQHLKYRPSTLARGMRGKTHCIGVLLVEMHNPFLPKVVDAISQSLKHEGYKTFISVGESDTSIEQSIIDAMLDQHMDGLILIAPRLSGEHLRSIAIRKPTVVVGHHEPSSNDFDTVNCDDFSGAYMATEALIESGCQNVHMLSLPRFDDVVEVFSLREKGHLKAIEVLAVHQEPHIWRINERDSNFDVACAQIFEGARKPDGVFCWSDIHALQLLSVAHERKIKVPGDLSVVGFDNTSISALPMVGLSSVDQFATKIGNKAATLLMSRIFGRLTSEHLLVEPALVKRNSINIFE
jgi:LacI family transcriptional regulator